MTMTKADILNTAKAQLALDYNCDPSDFGTKTAVFAENYLRDGRRVYKSDGCAMRLVSFCGTAAYKLAPPLVGRFRERLGEDDAAWLFEQGYLRFFNASLAELGERVADGHSFFLPVPEDAVYTPPFPYRVYGEDELERFRGDDRFTEALSFNPDYPDRIAITAESDGEIFGMAAASSDSATMWQIGVDVTEPHRGKGMATSLVRALKCELLRRGIVPFYGTCESHHISKLVAYGAGFAPAWSELYSEKLPSADA